MNNAAQAGRSSHPPRFGGERREAYFSGRPGFDWGSAYVFLTALKALPKAERDAVVVRIARDKAFARDILDLALIAKRRNEPSRPFRGCLSNKNGR